MRCRDYSSSKLMSPITSSVSFPKSTSLVAITFSYASLSQISKQFTCSRNHDFFMKIGKLFQIFWNKNSLRRIQLYVFYTGGKHSDEICILFTKRFSPFIFSSVFPKAALGKLLSNSETQHA